MYKNKNTSYVLTTQYILHGKSLRKIYNSLGTTIWKAQNVFAFGDLLDAAKLLTSC